MAESGHCVQDGKQCQATFFPLGHLHESLCLKSSQASCLITLQIVPILQHVDPSPNLMTLSIGTAGHAGDNNGTAANGDSKRVDNSPKTSEESGTANTAAKGASRKGNGKSHGGGHDSSPEGSHSDMGVHAVITHEGPAGIGPNVAAKPESDTAKTAGRELEDGDADNGHHAAQMAETGTAQKGTAANDAGAVKKKHNKGKKKKKNK